MANVQTTYLSYAEYALTVDAVMEVHAALESASSQLAQHPTTGLFFINVRSLTEWPLIDPQGTLRTVCSSAGPHPEVCPCGHTEGTELIGTAASLQGACGSCAYNTVHCRKQCVFLVFQLSKDQAEEAIATVSLLRASGTAFCNNTHQQLDQAMLACDLMPTMPVRKSPMPATAKEYVTKLPQLLSMSKFSRARKHR